MVASNFVLIPLKPDKDDLRGARTVLDAARAAGRLRPDLRILGLVLQQFELTTCFRKPLGRNARPVRPGFPGSSHSGKAGSPRSLS
jgi:cellulose biosynthesis protein BcsQ